MKMLVADSGETLRQISTKHQFSLKDLINLNPHISNPDQTISGKLVYLDLAKSSKAKENSPPSFLPPTCPPLLLPHYLNQWIPLNSLYEMAKQEYDVLIVGSGAGGGAVLSRLCERFSDQGKKIGMVEAGGLLLSTNAQNVSTLEGNRFIEFAFNPKISIPAGFPEFPAARLLYALGGRTLVWDVNSPRMHPSVLKKWPVSLEEMELYYNIAEREMNVTKAYSNGSPVNETLLSRLWHHGFTKATETPRAMNLTPFKKGIIHSDVFFSSILFLAKALNLKSYDLAVDARATRILTEKGSGYRVEVMDQEKNVYVLKTKNIVLSASTFETPRLLLHSGIQGNAIGHYLIDHAALKVSAVVGLQNLPQVSGPLHILVPPTQQLPYQFLIAKVGDIPDGHVEIIMRGYGTVEPRFENKVELDPRRVDEFGVPKLNVHYSYTPRDEDTIRKTAGTMEQVLKALGITEITEDICLRPPGDDHHESGTCRMGDDPATSATNRYGQIHGYPGLYVADNSILPSLGVANPTLTTVALAIRTADYIANKEGGI